MKPISILLLLVLAAVLPAPGAAQEPARAIDTLDVDIWPDYDRPSVLVLLTGALSPDTGLPASVTLPLPDGARLNAVARIDGEDGRMKDDIVSSVKQTGTLTFVTPDLRFRVEYYIPYSADGMQRAFDYTWSSALPVDRFRLKVQRPASAASLSTEPEAAIVRRSSDGFQYHLFPERPVAAGQTFSLRVVYTMADAQLSASVPPPDPATPPAPQAGGRASGWGFNWALAAVVVGGILFIGALVWQIASRRGPTAVPSSEEPRGQKETGAAVNFCGNCGKPAVKGDRFCRGCGSKL